MGFRSLVTNFLGGWEALKLGSFEAGRPRKLRSYEAGKLGGWEAKKFYLPSTAS